MDLFSFKHIGYAALLATSFIMGNARSKPGQDRAQRILQAVVDGDFATLQSLLENDQERVSLVELHITFGNVELSIHNCRTTVENIYSF